MFDTGRVEIPDLDADWGTDFNVLEAQERKLVCIETARLEETESVLGC